MNIVGPAIGFLVGGIIIDVLYVDFYAVKNSKWAVIMIIPQI